MQPRWPTPQETWRMIIPASHQFVCNPFPVSEEFWAIHLWATTISSPFPLCSAYSEQSSQLHTLVCVNIRWYKDKCHSFCSWPVAWWAWYSVGYLTVWPQVVWRSGSAHQCCLPVKSRVPHYEPMKWLVMPFPLVPGNYKKIIRYDCNSSCDVVQWHVCHHPADQPCYAPSVLSNITTPGDIMTCFGTSYPLWGLLSTKVTHVRVHAWHFKHPDETVSTCNSKSSSSQVILA